MGREERLQTLILPSCGSSVSFADFSGIPFLELNLNFLQR